MKEKRGENKDFEEVPVRNRQEHDEGEIFL